MVTMVKSNIKEKEVYVCGCDVYMETKTNFSYSIRILIMPPYIVKSLATHLHTHKHTHTYTHTQVQV